VTDLVLQGGDPRRAAPAAVGCLGLGVVLVLVGVTTQGAFGATTLVGAVAALVGLVLLARLPHAFDRSVLSVRPDGLAWTGVGDADWAAPWTEVLRVRLERGRRTSYVVVGLREDAVPLACRPAALDDVRRALARVGPGVEVTDVVAERRRGGSHAAGGPDPPQTGPRRQ